MLPNNIWNTISVPSEAADMHTTNLWPNAGSPAITWNSESGGFLTNDPDPVKAGVGYYVKFPTAQLVGYVGKRTDATDVHLVPDWNMIGSLSQSLPVSKISPSGIITSAFFTDNNGYIPVTTIEPGRGYWVKVNDVGDITLDVNSIASSPLASVQDYPPSMPGTPPRPTLSSPADGSTGQSILPTLSWTSSTGALSYRMQISTDPNFYTSASDQQYLAGTSTQPPALQYATKYYWHVNASDGDLAGAWSARQSFTTVPPDPPSSLTWTAFLGNDQVRHPRLSWTASAGAQDYQVFGYNCRPRNGDTEGPTLAVVGDFASGGYQPDSPAPAGCGEYFDCEGIPELKGTVMNGTSFDDPTVSVWSYSLDDPCPGSFDFYFVQARRSGLSSGPSPKVVISDGLTGDWKTGKRNTNGERQIPNVTSLSANYPNPFNPKTTFQYALHRDGYVTLRIYNALGQLVSRVIDEAQSAGYKTAEFDASLLPSGIYFYRLQAGNFSDVKKMALMK
jgi:hypothetical protein